MLSSKKREKIEKPIHVLHIFGALNPGGVELFVMNVYRAINRDEIQFDFALTQGKKSFFDDEVTSLGGRIFYFDTAKSILSNLSSIDKQYGSFDAVHSHVYFFSGLVLAWAKCKSIPVRIAHAHNTSFGQNNTVFRLLYERIMRWLIQLASTDMLGCSEDACKYVYGEDCFEDSRCQVICNGFNVKSFQFDSKKRTEIRHHYHIPDDSIVIGHVGRFEEQKNHTMLVDIFSMAHEMNDNTYLLLVGRGSLRQQIEDKCGDLSISDKVLFVGAQKNVADYLSAMDVFLFPSLYEGLGSVLVEAQANGLHVITSRDVVPNEVNITGNAVFVSLDESVGKWASITMGNTKREESSKCIIEVSKEYDISIICHKLMELYTR